ncbi:2179_t:CDS:2, partial [Scutellospora calospora]
VWLTKLDRRDKSKETPIIKELRVANSNREERSIRFLSFWIIKECSLIINTCFIFVHASLSGCPFGFIFCAFEITYIKISVIYKMAELREKLSQYIGFEPEKIRIPITEEDRQLFQELIAIKRR